MSSEVRVHVRLGGVRVVFHGDRAFYESHVEQLVGAAARRGPRAPSGLADSAIRGSDSAGDERALAASDVDTTDVAAPANDRGDDPRAPAADSERFVPMSSELGRYVRRLGPEAADPDRQVVALAFFLWNYEKRATFGVGELEGCFRALGLALPPGIDGILADLTDRKRFLEPADDGAWRLSRKGENYVKTRLLAA
jgi:hypothetical protein